MNEKDQLKREAALYALRFVPKANAIVGVGSGTTVKHFITELGRKRKKGDFSGIKFVPTSFDTMALLEKYDLPIVSLPEFPLDLTVDGADEITRDGFLLKGGGGALLREKIVRRRSKKFYVIADTSKLVLQLGKFPVAVEILPFSYKATIACFNELFPQITVDIRKSTKKLGPVITDNRNYIIDLYFGAITDPIELERQINDVIGVIECGIFVKKPTQIIIGSSNGIELLF